MMPTTDFRNASGDNTVAVDALQIGSTAVTSSAAELNKLDGVTATASELNILDGVTATSAEINLLDNAVAGATIVVGADAGTTVTVTIQLTDAAGADMATRAWIGFYVSSDANGDALATATDGGIAIGTDGLMIEWTADLAGILRSEADGDIDIVFTDSDAGTWYLVLLLPGGKSVISDAITFTA